MPINTIAFMKQIVIIGNMGADATVKQIEDSYLVNFSLAVYSTWYNAQGEKQEKTDWFSCFHRYRKSPENLLPYLLKGSKLALSGTPDFEIQNYNGSIKMGLKITYDRLEIISSTKAKGDGEQ